MSVKNAGAGALATMPPPARLQQLLFTLRAADMQLTTDQAFAKQFVGTAYYVTQIVAKRVSGAVAALTAGGIYVAASKAGTPLVAAAQVWTALTGANTLQVPTLAAVINSTLQSATPILSLTVGSSTPATVDIFIFGFVID